MRQLKKVWWKCSECGYIWQTSINHRTTKKTGCPECAKKIRASKYSKQYVENKHTSLSDNYPDLLMDWHYKMNSAISPTEVSYGSAVKVWWKCHECGFEWQTSVKSRTSGSQCPCCNNENSHKKAISKFLKGGENDLATLFPLLASEWDYEKNKELPNQFTAGSGQKVWWRCNVCSNSWQAIIGNRTKHNSGCPECAKKR